MTTRKFADILLSINSVNASAIEASVDAFVDTIGVALAGTSEDCSVISQRWLRSTQSKPQAVVWGTDIVCSVSDAAFANGISSHALDFDDAMPSSSNSIGSISIRRHVDCESKPLTKSRDCTIKQLNLGGRVVLEGICVGSNTTAGNGIVGGEGQVEGVGGLSVGGHRRVGTRGIYVVGEGVRSPR
jgi:hypothetical protein